MKVSFNIYILLNILNFIIDITKNKVNYHQQNKSDGTTNIFIFLQESTARFFTIQSCAIYTI